MSKYAFAIRETRTAEVIRDVSTMRSEIGILYLSDFNRKSLEKMMKSAGLEFHYLIECQAYVYLWKNHPLAGEDSISFQQLADYLNVDRSALSAEIGRMQKEGLIEVEKNRFRIRGSCPNVGPTSKNA